MVDQDRVVQLRTKFDQIMDEPSPQTSAANGSGGEPPWLLLERRVAKLEENMEDVRLTLKDLAPRIIETQTIIKPMRGEIDALKTQNLELSKDVSETKGIVRNLPSFTQTTFLVLTILAVTFAALALIQR